MAFQSPFLSPASAATSELLPSMSNAIAAPWRTLKRASRTSSSALLQRRSASHRTPIEGSSTSRPPALPEFLDTASTSVLRSELQRLKFIRPASASTTLSQSLSRMRTGSLTAGAGARNPFWTIQNTMTAAVTSSRPSSRRSYATLPCLQPNCRRTLSKVDSLSRPQQLRFMFGGTSQSLLAHRERTANNNPQSVTAQNAFYSALLQAKMAPIIIERYESGRFPTNAYTDSIYAKALDQVGGESVSGLSHHESQGTNTINTEQLQAIGQAIANSQNKHSGKSRISVRQENAGPNDSRLRVVLEETKSAVALRWVKFIAYFALTGVFLFLSLNFVIEATGALQNVQQAKRRNLVQQQKQTVRFSDVHGCDQAKEELQELVEFLQNPDRFNTLGGKLPKGVLLVGPPGTGKTLLARAVAGEAGVPFFYMSGSEFDEVYVGVGARRVRELFNQARGKAPAIIFIDELDAIGSRRNERDAAYVKQTLNQLLTELDGFSQTSGVIILAATNFPQLLDKALTRPGRFDRKVQVPLPDVRGRVSILNHHLKKVPISTDVDVTLIARGTPGFSGADLENLVNQAAIRASRDKKPKVDPKDFDWAKDKIMMGAENRSLVVRDEDKLMTAYHEAGHALVAYFTPRATPLYKVTIIPRGAALGLTHQLPEIDVVSRDFTQYLTDIDVCMGGRAAEQLIYGGDKVTSGCASDLEQATRTAHMMVTRLGFSAKLGSVDLYSDYRNLSSETKQEIEAEVRRLVTEASDRATTLLRERRKELELVTRALIEYESLTKAEIDKILRGEKLDKLESLPKAPITLPDALLTPGINPNTNPPALRDESSPGEH